MAIVRGNLRGLRELQEQLQRIPVRLGHMVVEAMTEEAKIEMAESRRRAPRDTGRLKRSHRVTRVQVPSKSGRQTYSVGIAAGSDVVSPNTAWYALIVHENVGANFKEGQAKFLESTLRESAPYMADRIARRLDLRNLVKGR